VRNGPNLNRTFTVRRKAAKRILPWDLPVDEIQLVLPRPQDEDTRETKRPRLEEPVHITTDEAATNTTSHDTTVALPPAADAADHHADANADPVADTQPNARTSGATGRWTLVEDAKLTSAVTKTRKKEHSKNWVTISALVPGRTKKQCWRRWRNVLEPSIDGVNGCTGTWKEDEDIKLKGAVQKLGDKDWVAIAALVPGRTKKQCWNRWKKRMDPNRSTLQG
jgi:hypothetical protein